MSTPLRLAERRDRADAEPPDHGPGFEGPSFGWIKKRYSLIGPIVRLGQAGGDVVGTTPEITAALADAVRFAVEADLRLTSDDLGVSTRAKATLEAPDLRLLPASLAASTPLVVEFEGAGTITEQGGVIARSRGSRFTMDELQVPTMVTLALDPCGSITVDAEPWGDNETVTVSKGMGSLTMDYPGTGMWDSAMRTALRRSRDGLEVAVEDGEATLRGRASLGYTDGDTSAQIKAVFDVTQFGDEVSGGEEP